MKIFFLILILLKFLFGEIAFLGFEDNIWKIFILKDFKILKSIDTKLEPRSFDIRDNKIVYIASDDTLRIIEDDNETIILKRGRDSYIQPKFSVDGKKVYVVKLIDGTSRESDIIEINLKTLKIKDVVNQRSTQLEPYIRDNKNLYYTNVICTIGCGKIISEIWHKNIISGMAEGITLTNAISQQPYIDENEENLYFSSDIDGNFHIWRYTFKSKKYRKLTNGDITDSFPVSIEDKLYFIRQIGNEYKLIVKENNFTKEIELPKEIIKIRYLRGI
jgi:tricorn protease-like protein